MARLTFSGSQTIAEYLRARGLSDCSNVRLSLLSGGQSHPTYIVDDGAQLATQSMKVIKAGPAEFGAFISGEIARWGALIKANHIVIN